MTQEALNIAGQCRATASSSLAKNILVDEGNGLLTELLLDAAKVIEALAQPEQEPVATLDDLEQEIYENTRQFVSRDVMEWMLKRYYTTPPQRTEPVIDQSAAKRIATVLGWTPPRTWVGLTDEEVSEVFGGDIHAEHSGELRFVRAIEAKLKQKNGYTEEKNT